MSLDGYSNEKRGDRVISSTLKYSEAIFEGTFPIQKNLFENIVLWLFSFDDIFDKTSELTLSHLYYQNTILQKLSNSIMFGAGADCFKDNEAQFVNILQELKESSCYAEYSNDLLVSIVNIMNGYYTEKLIDSGNFNQRNYLDQARVTIALEFVFICLLISFEISRSSFRNLGEVIRHGSLVIRLANDFAGLNSDKKDGKITQVVEMYNSGLSEADILSNYVKKIDFLMKQVDLAFVEFLRDDPEIRSIFYGVISEGVKRYLNPLKKFR